MTLQEILTYVEELAFKNSMFGYDKDEVDIQLDKICDEVEALVTQKDKEIEELKRALTIVNTTPDAQPEDMAAAFSTAASDKAMAAADEGESISPEDYDALVVECTQLKIALEQAKADVEAAREEAKQSDEAAKMLVSQIDNAQAMIDEAQDQAREAEAQVEALKAELAEAREAAKAAPAEETSEELDAVDTEEIVEEPVAEVAEPEVKAAAPFAGAAGDPQSVYLKYADLLCKQLEENETAHERIVAEANVEADQIRSDAQAEADKLLAEAQSVFETKSAEADLKVQDILEGAKAEAEEIISKAKAEGEELGKEFEANAAVAEERCKALEEKKDSLVASLSGFGEEIAALIAKVTGPVEAEAAEEVEEAEEEALEDDFLN